jgi:serine/threonine protein kinase/tetratricopeptide (TPR) repeat protein
MSEPCDRAKSIFLAAIDHTAPEQWPAFLDQACAGDRSLRAEVERLLRAQAALGSFHEADRCTPAATAEYPACEAPGTAVGPYKLLEQIGEGGFGVVFLAEQQEPIRRRVALKVLKPGMDTKRVLARFEAERQALALMDHSKIARVLDAGATDSGRPYFVMELVKGGPITQFCDQHRLAVEARLRLFLDVCRAIQHAHHKGVIHRDIKPGNVLVALHESPPHPTLSPSGGEGRVRGAIKVIDFGIAKALAAKLTERTLYTTHGEMIGTPEYMSPEQAEVSELDIDTRSDVYGLGVLLYELLTGTTPLEGKRLRKAGYAEMQRLIREEELPRPSVRLQVLGESAAVVAGNRGLDVRRLAQLLADDLDWVVMKALEKDRSRRYGTPGSFAADIKRYLRREAVLARPPSTFYKMKRFGQRHRAGVLVTVAVAAALLVGAAVAVWQAVVATRAKQDALAAARAEMRSKKLAQTREAETRAVLDFVENRIIAAARPEGEADGLGHEVTLRRAIEAALPFVEKGFPDQPLIEARLRLTLGRSFLYLGQPKLAVEQDRAARAIYRKWLGPDHPHTLTSTHNLAGDYAALGRSADARRLHQATLAARKARLGSDHRDTLRSMGAVASCWSCLGRHADALRLRRETFARQKAALGPDDPDTLATMSNLANCLGAVGRHADALRLHEATVARFRARFGPDHPDTLRSMHNLANSYGALARHADALQLRKQTAALMEAKLGPDHPHTRACRHNLFVGMNDLAWFLATAPDESLRDPAKAVTYAMKAVEMAPRNAQARGTLGTARYSAGDWKGAITDLERAIRLRVADDPDKAFEGFFLAMACWQIGEKDKARAWFARAVRRMEKGGRKDCQLKRFRAQAARMLRVDGND